MKSIPLKHLRRRVSIARDDNGVPHVAATSWRGALYGLGYMHAIDRPTQLLFARAVASGRSAEQIADKPELVETDRFFRRAGLYLNLDREVDQLDDSTFDQLTAYCEGVNDGLKDAGRSLPMWATGFVPTPWTQQAVLLVGNLLSYGGLVVGQQENERILLELIQAGVEDDKMRELSAPLLDHEDFDLLRQVQIRRTLSDEALELLTDLPRLAGSNAWAVSPKRSATGSALLASDPHLEIHRLPAIWYEAVLRWGPHGEQFAMGATLPGCPLFAVARTERLGWGVTYLKGDTSDSFIEDCRTGGGSGWQYRRGDSWRDFERRRETILRKGNSPEVLDVYFNAQGTLERDPQPERPGYYLSTAWIGDRAGAGLDRHVARHRRGPEHGRSDGDRPGLPAAYVMLGVCRQPRAYRPPGEWLVSGAGQRHERPAADPGLGRAQSLAGPAAGLGVALGLRSARGLRGRGQRRHEPAGRTAVGDDDRARLSPPPHR